MVIFFTVHLKFSIHLFLQIRKL